VFNRNEEKLPSRPAYFWWLLANALAICFAVISWAVCLDVFGNPEVPRNYEVLRKLKRLPVLKRYSLTDVPNGNSLTPKELYQKYFGYSTAEASSVNSLLMRNYLSNFDRPLLLAYVEGDYQVTDVRKLNATDFFYPGVVIRAQALVKPDDFTKPLPYPIFIEYLVPTSHAENISAIKIDSVVSLKKSPHCAAVIHTSKVLNQGDMALLLTVTPIVYGTSQLGDAVFELEPPAQLRPAAKFPAF
jgi:hypothetical protein